MKAKPAGTRLSELPGHQNRYFYHRGDYRKIRVSVLIASGRLFLIVIFTHGGGRNLGGVGMVGQ